MLKNRPSKLDQNSTSLITDLIPWNRPKAKGANRIQTDQDVSDSGNSHFDPSSRLVWWTCRSQVSDLSFVFFVEVLFPKTFLSCRPTSSKSPAFHASPSLHNLNLETRRLYTLSARDPALWQAPNLPKKPTEIRLCDQNDKYPLLQPIFRQLQAWQLVCQIDRFLRDGFRIISGTKTKLRVKQ